MAKTSKVRVERLADCPFAIAQEYVEEFLFESERGGPNAVLRAGPARARVRVGFGIRNDRTERGRGHDEITLTWSAASPLLPQFHGTIRFRIAHLGTRFILEGAYTPPGGFAGALFDAAIGRRIARATATDLLERICRHASLREAAWRAKNAS